MMTLADVKNGLLARGNGFALDLVRKIEVRAAREAMFAESLAAWLRSKSTVVLRDELAAPFKDAALVRYVAAERGLSPTMAFQACWEAMDSVAVTA